jgi:hypothetical protein
MEDAFRKRSALARGGGTCGYYSLHPPVLSSVFFDPEGSWLQASFCSFSNAEAIRALRRRLREIHEESSRIIRIEDFGGVTI